MRKLSLSAAALAVTLLSGSASFADVIGEPRVADSRHEAPLTDRARAAIGVLREAAVVVVFRDGVSREEAGSLLASAGSSRLDVLAATDRGVRAIEVTVPVTQLTALRMMPEVLLIDGPRRVIQPTNIRAAQLSHVNELAATPYRLTGAGVVVSMWDVGAADATHVEFGGRLTKHSAVGVKDHPTHVAGTIAAAGIRPESRGMAPAATLHQFHTDDHFTTSKDVNLPALGVAVDNNSWNFIAGWSYNPGRPYRWEWYGDSDFGAYTWETSEVDRLTRDHEALLLFSAGNDPIDTGPAAAPFAHHHAFESSVYCYSASGSGSDCPSSPCQKCEVPRHPPDGPFNTMSLVAAGKNVLAVGAVQDNLAIASFSSRGPSRDGRVKPDVVANGTGVFSTVAGGQYASKTGTSQAVPVVTGTAALLSEQWIVTFGRKARPEELRAVIIAGAKDLGPAGPDATYGFGLVDARAAADLILHDRAAGRRIRNGSLSQGAMHRFGVALRTGQPLRLTLVWPDVPAEAGAESALVNDLDVRVVGPDGSPHLPYLLNVGDPAAAALRAANHRDTVEQIELTADAAGTYTVEVSGYAISTAEPQRYVLVSSVTFADAPPSRSRAARRR